MDARIRWVLPQRPVPDLLLGRWIIGPDGVARQCRMEFQLGDVRRSEEVPACDKPAPPAAMIRALRAQSNRRDVQVRHETRLVRDATAPLPALASADDRMMLRAVTRFVVEPGGRVSNCQMLDFMSLIGSEPQPCRSIRFVANDKLTAPTEMRIVTAIVLEGEGKSP